MKLGINFDDNPTEVFRKGSANLKDERYLFYVISDEYNYSMEYQSTKSVQFFI
jgi:hypothetical protein